MSDTPEIDAAELYYDGPTGFVPIEDARKVERKLNDALKENARLRPALMGFSQAEELSKALTTRFSFSSGLLAGAGRAPGARGVLLGSVCRASDGPHAPRQLHQADHATSLGASLAKLLIIDKLLHGYL